MLYLGFFYKMNEYSLEDFEIVEGSTVGPEEFEYHVDNIPEIIAACVRIINIVIGCFVIYILKNYRQLRVQFYTSYIMHCNVLMTFNLILLLFSYLFCYIYPEKFIFHCIDFIFSLALIPGEYTLWILMTIDWLLAVYDTDKSGSFRRWYSLTVILIYVYSISAVILFPALCHIDIVISTAIFLSMFAFLFRLLTIIIATGVYFYKRKTQASVAANISVLSMSVITFASWILLAVTFVMQSFYLYWIGVCVATCNPILTLTLCYYFDVNFRTRLTEIMKSICGQSSELEGGSDAVTMAYSHQINQLQAEV